MPLTKKQTVLAAYESPTIGVLEEMLRSDDVIARSSAAGALAVKGWQEGPRMIVLALVRETNNQAKIYFVDALAHLRGKRVATRWLTAAIATSDDEVVLCYGIRNLRYMKASSAVWLAESVIDDPRPSVKFEALLYLYSVQRRELDLSNYVADIRAALSNDPEWKGPRYGPGGFFTGREYLKAALSAIEHGQMLPHPSTVKG